ncbi:MAG: DEAD/DEAH box helicase [Desulfurispora sp.]|uniref:DEAD/DEAH box helicase n=1 Tax=Desulfurispora sp. TaxID=3014275 RepID=UPI00404B874B
MLRGYKPSAREMPLPDTLYPVVQVRALTARDRAAGLALRGYYRPQQWVRELTAQEQTGKHYQIPAERLGRMLLAWHRPSFYGSFVPVDEEAGEVLLSPLTALQLLVARPVLRHLYWTWPDEWPGLQYLARLVDSFLRRGAFMPSWTAWREGRAGWQICPLPEISPGEEELAPAGDWAAQALQLAGQLARMGVPDAAAVMQGVGEQSPAPVALRDDLPPEIWPALSGWLDAVLQEIQGQTPAAAVWYQQLVRQYPLILPGKALPVETPADSGEWLEAIGWLVDDSPWQSCLKLYEPPDGRGDWLLRVVLRHKKQPASEVEITDGQLPEPCREHARRLGRDVQRWIRLLPFLPLPGEGRAGEHRPEAAVAGVSASARQAASPAVPVWRLNHRQAWQLMTEGAASLTAAGYILLLPAWWEEVRRQRPALLARPRSQAAGSGFLGMQQLLDFDWQVAIGGQEISPGEFARLLKEQQPLVHYQGRWVYVDQTFWQRLRRFMQRHRQLSLAQVLQLYFAGQLIGQGEEAGEAPASGPRGRGKKPAGAALEDADGDAAGPPGSHEAVPGAQPSIQLQLSAAWQATLDTLVNCRQLPWPGELSGFAGTLRPYQQKGAAWLVHMRALGLGACLADDMGLGKTVQFIAYLCCLQQRGELTGPSLLVCPTSVLGNWQKELERFAPQLRLYLHHGTRRPRGQELLDRIGNCQLVITSYALAHLDREDLQAVQWDCLCLDEAQNIKNHQTRQAAAVRSFTARHRLALTGTPLENRLEELWSLMHFLNPGYLGSHAAFVRHFGRAAEAGRSEPALATLQRLVQPFLLRRLKSDPEVELDLPEKLEMKEYIALSPAQAALYQNVLDDLQARLGQVEGLARRGLVLSALTRLKLICDHPGLLRGAAAPGRSEPSPKLQRLGEMVEQVRQSGGRCLVFTQFVTMGRLIQQYLQELLGEPVLFLHGGTPRAMRDQLVEQFQQGLTEGGQPAGGGAAAAPGVLVMTLKAGGTGLNLTAANYVFHFDRWWNPAVENQATDRAYRMGQRRSVQVYKFITLGTLEERIDEMLEHKLELAGRIIGSGEAWLTELSDAELGQLLALQFSGAEPARRSGRPQKRSRAGH